MEYRGFGVVDHNAVTDLFGGIQVNVQLAGMIVMCQPGSFAEFFL